MNLWALLQDKKDDSIKAVSEKLLFQGSEQGPFIVRVNPDFVKALAFVSDANRREIADVWSQSEGLTGLTPTYISAMVGQMSDFARRSRHENKSILGLFAV